MTEGEAADPPTAAVMLRYALLLAVALVILLTNGRVFLVLFAAFLIAIMLRAAGLGPLPGVAARTASVRIRTSALGRPCGHGRRRRTGLHAAGGREEISGRTALVVAS